MDKKQKNMMRMRTGRRKARLAKKAQLLLHLQPLAGDSKRLVLMEWHGPSRKVVATVIDAAETNEMVAAAKRPTISPIRGDPSHVLRCDWKDLKGWHCDIISVNDPKARH